MTCLNLTSFARRMRLSLAALPIACLAGFIPAGAASGASDELAALTSAKPNLTARYTVYVGGFLFANASLAAHIDNDAYNVNAKVAAAGIPRDFFTSKWDFTSRGHFSDGRAKPQHYVFNSIETHETKKTILVYDKHGMPKLTLDPPQATSVTVQPFERANTQDPVSTFLMPVPANGKNPCDRTVAIFDGKRRYDLQFAFEKEDLIETRDKGYSGKALVCAVTFKPGTGTERKSFTTMLRRNGDTRIWLASMNGGKVYVPVKLQVRTPIGGAVMEMVNYAQTTKQAEATATLTK